MQRLKIRKRTKDEALMIEKIKNRQALEKIKEAERLLEER